MPPRGDLSALIRLLRYQFKSHLLDLMSWGRQLYWRWRAPVTVGVQGIILDQDRVLLVRHSYGDRRTWHLPGGAIKRRETLVEALKREVKEELNAEIDIERLHGLYYNFKRGASDHIVVFVGGLKNPERLKRGWEIAAFDFFDLDALPESISVATRRRLDEYLTDASSIVYRRW